MTDIIYKRGLYIPITCSLPLSNNYCIVLINHVNLVYTAGMWLTFLVIVAGGAYCEDCSDEHIKQVADECKLSHNMLTTIASWDSGKHLRAFTRQIVWMMSSNLSSIWV